MNEITNETLTLDIVDAPRNDSNKKMARLSNNDIEKLDLRGGLAFIKGNERETAVLISVGGNPAGSIGLPSMMRRNVGNGSSAVSLRPIDSEWSVATSLKLEIIAFEDTSMTTPVQPSPSSPELPMHEMAKQGFLAMYRSRTPMVDGDVFHVTFPNTAVMIDVQVSLPSGVYKIDTTTTITVIDKSNMNQITDIGWEDVGGMGDVVKDMRFFVELPLVHPELFDHYYKKSKNNGRPSGILLRGPPGCGKTLLVKAIAKESDANFVMVTPPEIFSKFVGESEGNIRKLFDEVREKAPCILFFDEIDAILPKRDEHIGSAEQRVVSEILNQMDGLRDLGQVIVIGATNRPNAIEPAARRPGRFEREIDILPPNEEGRKEIFQIHLRDLPVVTEDDDTGSAINIDELAAKTNGYVGADIAGLVRESVIKNLKRNLPGIDLEQCPIPIDQLTCLNISQEDLLESMNNITPSALRSLQIEIPDVSFNDIGGYEQVKQKLDESVNYVFTKKDLVKKIGITLPRGIMLFGPPGCSKTMLAKAIANESQCNFISVKGPEFLSKWVGETERMVREVFALARRTAPTIIFFDEFDSIVPTRGTGSGDGLSGVQESVVAQILSELDGIEARDDVILIASTNRPDMIDPAILRKGRIDRIILVPAPGELARKKIFEVHFNGKNVDKDLENTLDKACTDLAKRTANYSGADIASVIMESGILALNDNRDFITGADVMNALEDSSPSLTPRVIEFYDKLEQTFKSKQVERTYARDNYI